MRLKKAKRETRKKQYLPLDQSQRIGRHAPAREGAEPLNNRER